MQAIRQKTESHRSNRSLPEPDSWGQPSTPHCVQESWRGIHACRPCEPEAIRTPTEPASLWPCSIPNRPATPYDSQIHTHGSYGSSTVSVRVLSGSRKGEICEVPQRHLTTTNEPPRDDFLDEATDEIYARIEELLVRQLSGDQSNVAQQLEQEWDQIRTLERIALDRDYAHLTSRDDFSPQEMQRILEEMRAWNTALEDND